MPLASRVKPTIRTSLPLSNCGSTCNWVIWQSLSMAAKIKHLDSHHCLQAVISALVDFGVHVNFAQSSQLNSSAIPSMMVSSLPDVDYSHRRQLER